MFVGYRYEMLRAELREVLADVLERLVTADEYAFNQSQKGDVIVQIEQLLTWDFSSFFVSQAIQLATIFELL